MDWVLCTIGGDPLVLLVVDFLTVDENEGLLWREGRTFRAGTATE